MLARYYFLRQIRFLYCCFVCLSFLGVVLLTAFTKIMLPSVHFRITQVFAHLPGSPQLWPYTFLLSLTSPHAPFIYPLNWKKVIGLEAVLTCFMGYSSKNHSSGIPFSTKRIQFPVEVLRLGGRYIKFFRLFSANALQVLLQVGLYQNNPVSAPTTRGTWCLHLIKTERTDSGTQATSSELLASAYRSL